MEIPKKITKELLEILLKQNKLHKSTYDILLPMLKEHKNDKLLCKSKQ